MILKRNLQLGLEGKLLVSPIAFHFNHDARCPNFSGLRDAFHTFLYQFLAVRRAVAITEEFRGRALFTSGLASTSADANSLPLPRCVRYMLLPRRQLRCYRRQENLFAISPCLHHRCRQTAFDGTSITQQLAS